MRFNWGVALAVFFGILGTINIVPAAFGYTFASGLNAAGYGSGSAYNDSQSINSFIGVVQLAIAGIPAAFAGWARRREVD